MAANDDTEDKSACFQAFNAFEIAQCVGKQSFSGRKEAARVVREIEKREKRPHFRGRNLRAARQPYQCAACGQWHLGRPSR